MKTIIFLIYKHMLPLQVRVWISGIKKKVCYYLKYRGKSRYCPVCGKSSRIFLSFGVPPFQRKDAECFYCGAVERHRLLWLFLQKKTCLFSVVPPPKKMLHIAAEPYFEKKFRRIFGKNYLTADLYNPRAMIKMDITNIAYSNDVFDIIICNHVLEHVNNDIQAMGELYRVLKKDGWAILLAPVADIDKTYEDFSITTPEGRLAAFGQDDHVRKYGRDYIDRLKSVGFKVTITQADELADNDEIQKMRLKENSVIWGFQDTEIYYCTK